MSFVKEVLVVKNKWNFIFHFYPFVFFFIALYFLYGAPDQEKYNWVVYFIPSMILLLFNMYFIMYALKTYDSFFIGLVPNLITWGLVGMAPYFISSACAGAWISFLLIVGGFVMNLVYFEVIDP